MASIRARLVNLALPLLGIRRFFSQPDRLDARIAKLRRQKPVRPRAKWHQRFAIHEFASRGYPVVTIEPKAGAKPGAPHLLYLHGGGYVMDIAALHWDTVMDLCERLGASATVPLYPLAPEAKAAGTLDQMRALYLELAERYGADNLTVMGDSAGGGMTLALAQMLRDEGAALPASLVLYSPWLDATGKAEGQRAIEPRDRMLAVSGLEACGAMYRGDLAVEDPRVSPLFGDLAGLPPMAIFSGTADILLVDGRRLAQRLAEPGMPDHIYREYADMFHVWMLLPVPEAMQARAETVEFIREHRKAA
ncbi:alpha/beta hydrolase [Qipengyuania sp. YG27]|uniref:Alpha/beta hydrolase n=1 Tax=Qipengyuania mesophila TaxID=2867246 RepID=A0ABS7JT11_9SPHN|nr:alpha/beta hydrolase [Qipengyuania mesophila]MBX7500795.1 alpha/beta hydrolase [Qipengyuania mesophila]